ncbi:MAG: hypothetical protein ACOCRO_02035 [Halanaerobiales bacterium]
MKTINIDPMNVPRRLTFEYHMYGDDMGKLEVRARDADSLL